MIKKLYLVLPLAFVFSSLNAQTLEDRNHILKDVDPVEVVKLEAFLKQQSQNNKEQVRLYLLAHPQAKTSIYRNGEELWLERIDHNGNPVYIGPDNVNGALTIGANELHNGGSLGLDIEGQGITAVIWDGGYSRATHQEFTNRVIYGETGKSFSDHATHVGGTIIASGLSPSLKGMAPKGSLRSYRFDDDNSEMFSQAAAGALLSNHSYGTVVDENTFVAYYGKYDDNATSFDFITKTYPYYLPVVSAGNDRGIGLNPDDNGFDLLTDRSLSKNAMTVGAVEGLFQYTGPSSVEMSSFSSFGPTDDGRIKPDIVAKGVNVRSLGSSNDTDFGVKSGTSMSAPMVTGGLMLLQQLHKKQRSVFMTSATLKGLALMTTKEAGDAPGPDYSFGWGLFDVKAAAEMILNLGSSSHITEKKLANNASYQATFTSKGTDRLSFALSWTDQPGEAPPANSEEDDDRPMLVNDLDIKVTDGNGVEYFPYKLDGKNPTAPATKGVNSVDNIEIIHIDAPAGSYTVRVNHKGSLLGTQPYSLLVNGATPQTASTRSEEIQGLAVFPNPARNAFNVSFDTGTLSEDINITILNTLGQQVWKQSFKNQSSFNERIDISQLRSGMYLVKVTDGNRSSTRKLLVR